MMKAVLATTAIFAGTCVRAEIDPAKLGKIDIVSINKMVISKVVEAGNVVYKLNVDLTLQNGNVEAVKLRNGKFQTQAIAQVPKESKEGKEAKEYETVTLDIGEGDLAELVLPGTGDKKAPRTTEAQISVTVGPMGDTTVEKMIKLWNVVGNPESLVSLGLKGTSEVGYELPRGWVIEPGRRYEVDLKFEPKLQRRVLFQ
jgi:hypothetical protein